MRNSASEIAEDGDSVCVIFSFCCIWAEICSFVNYTAIFMYSKQKAHLVRDVLNGFDEAAAALPSAFEGEPCWL